MTNTDQRESHEMRSVGEQSRNANTVAPKIPETTHEPMYASRASSMTAREPVVRTLHTSLWPLVVFLFYATLAIFTWIVPCLASKRPIGSKQDYMNQRSYQVDLDAVFTKHEKFIRAAQILQPVVALLTIPITSAICSMALAAYIQAGSSRTKLNVRQTMALADQGWISPRIWMICSEVGSLPLYFTFGLTLVGAVFPIVQQTLIQVTTMQIPTSGTGSRFIMVPNIPALINGGNYGTSEIVVRLRNVLETTRQREYEPYLWTEQDNDKECLDSWRANRDCSGDERSLFLLDEAESDAWYAPVATNFNSGVYAGPQFVPRINTTITYANVNSDDWPSECVRDREGVFFVHYHKQSSSNEREVMACMPTNISNTPWQATYDRQDITEELYLAISADRTMAGASMFKVTARSSLGYFELPNAQNGNRAGPLLDKLSLADINNSNEKRETNETYAGNVTQEIGRNLGPLTTLGLALFGEGSFIERRLSNPSAFVVDRSGQDLYRIWENNCVSTTPLNFASDYNKDACLSSYDHSDDRHVMITVDRLIALFDERQTAKSALTIAAFLANKEWLSPSRGVYDSYQMSRRVYTNPGVPVKKTNISLAGIITGSVFLGLHLVGLLALAIYAVWGKAFMPWLGAEFMVKAGTAHAEILSAAEGDMQWKQTLAACPGFVGDERPADEVGRIAFGAKAGLSRLRDRKFENL